MKVADQRPAGDENQIRNLTGAARLAALTCCIKTANV